MENLNAQEDDLGNKKSGGTRRDQKEMWGPTRKDGSFGGRPPLSPGDLHNRGPAYQSIPQWEKKFCTSVCSIPWKKLCETRKLMYMYPTIVQWDDSEGEEAFHNAKARYWAKINNLPCPVPLPDPDMYIDAVDQNTILDPGLVEDLYKQPPSLHDDEGDKGIVWDSFQFTTDTVPVTGWGDEEDDPTIYATDQSIQIQATGWGDDAEVPTVCTVGQTVKVQPTGWDDEDPLVAIYTGDESIHIQPTGWDDIKNPTNEIICEDISPVNNSETRDFCGDYQWDYSWCRQGCRNKGLGKKGRRESWMTGRYRARKKAICAEGQTICYESKWESVPFCGPKGHREFADSRGAWKWQKSVS